jgi:DnaJ-class molecular chaperone
MRSEYKKYFKVFDLDVGASKEEVKSAFRELSQLYHPDNYARKSPEVQKRSEEKFKELSNAYDILKKYFREDSSREAEEKTKAEQDRRDKEEQNRNKTEKNRRDREAENRRKAEQDRRDREEQNRKNAEEKKSEEEVKEKKYWEEQANKKQAEQDRKDREDKKRQEEENNSNSKSWGVILIIAAGSMGGGSRVRCVSGYDFYDYK